MSAWPLIGEGPGKLSEHKIRLAMAIRTTNAHWKMKEIHRRHWLALGKRFGVLDDGGREMEVILDDLIARTPRVVADLEAGLPVGFPEHVAGSVLRGLQQAANQLGRG
jgi:serine/threonine-protein kinase HipA